MMLTTDFEIPRTHVVFDPGFTLRLPLTGAFIGSCFSEKIAQWLKLAGADILENPTGIIYNPVSIEQSILHAVKDIPYTEKDFFEYGDLFHGYEHHGVFSRTDLEEAVSAAETAREGFQEQLKCCDLFVITLGTAVVWEDLETGKIMANCHKLPESYFKRRILSIDECRKSLEKIISAVLAFQEKCRIVLTVSPVRHHPGDPMLNARSKAHLLAAARAAEESFQRTVYFPSYEILNDELRDYRFYKEDMVHPTEEAERFICSFFFRSFFGKEGETVFREAMRKSFQGTHKNIRKDGV